MRGDLTNLEQRHHLFDEAEAYGSAGVNSSTDDSEELATAAVRLLSICARGRK